MKLSNRQKHRSKDPVEEFLSRLRLVTQNISKLITMVVGNTQANELQNTREGHGYIS